MIPTKEIVSSYLDNIGATLWGRSFNVNSVEGKQEAVEFITALWTALEDEEVRLFTEQEILEDLRSGHETPVG